MKSIFTIFAALLLTGLVLSFSRPSAEEPWKPSQLLAPANLAAAITAGKAPVVLSIGPGAIIKGSIDIGPGRDSANINKLRIQLAKLPKTTPVVIYCGCCPFEHCPNVRPAFTLLNEMGFTQARLLNLEHNIKIDWINKGYPQN